MMTDQYPRLRALEAFPHETPNGLAVVLRDPLQISPEVLLVPPQLFALLTMMDGRRSLDDLRLEIERQTGQRASMEDLITVVARLDQARFLDNQIFRRHHDDLVRKFHEERVRDAFHAGQSYPSEPQALTDLLDSFYTHAEGAGSRPQPLGRSTPAAIVAPHIDLRLGGPTYTHPYRVLGESTPPDAFLILGIGHSGLPGFYSITMKDFQTPLGEVRCDRELAGRILAAGEGDFDEDFSHRSEHTIEFQAVFLRHLFGSQTPPVVPVLTSFCYPELDIRGQAMVLKFCRAVQAALQETGRKICVIASIDLAHIGPRYGDSFTPTADMVEETMIQDRAMLDLVATGDARAFVSAIRSEKDRRRICGFAALETLLHLIPEASGRILAQGHCLIDDAGSFVTYAGMVFTHPDAPDPGEANP